jgi:hypothetical protein
VINVLFYVDFMHVFSVRHGYCKANAFGWLMPLVCAALGNDYGFCVGLFVVLLTQIMIFAYVFHILIQDFMLNLKAIILTSMVLFFTMMVMTLPVYIIADAIENDSAIETFLTYNVLCGYSILVLCINLFFMLLDSHKLMWVDHLST